MSDLDRVTDSGEVSRLLGIAAQTATEFFCRVLTEPPIELKLEVRAAHGSNLVLGAKRTSASPTPLLPSDIQPLLKQGQQIEMIFGLVEGEFVINESIVAVSLTSVTVNVSRGLMKLQRRKDFRVSTKTQPTFFQFVDRKTQSVVKLELLDLSAGGLRLLWPPSAGPIPAPGTLLKGALLLPTEAQPEIEMEFVKNHGPQVMQVGEALSFRFQPLAQNEARAVWFACLQISRKILGKD